MIGIAKLLSGDELLAEITEEADSYLLKDPFMIGFNEKGTISIVPFMVYSKASDEVKIAKGAVICVVEARDEIAKQYQATTGRIITMDRLIQKH